MIAEDGPPAARTEKMQALEAVLLLAREPLSSRKLSQYANLADGTEALTLIRQLNRLYDEEGRAFRVEQIAGGFHLMTRPAFADWLRRLAGTPAEVRLSVPAMETLAVVSYRQPVLRADIEAIRGVACGEILRQLMERDLVRIQGRSEELGRPFLYGTTTRFLHVFGLASLDELPRSEILRRFAPEEAAATSQQQQVEGDTAVVMTEGASVMVMEAGAASGDALWDDPDTDAPAVDPTVVAEDDDEFEDDIDDDDDDDLDDDDDDDEDEDDDFDDDFDDEYDDDEEWEDDDEADELDDDEDEDEWEEVDDDEDDDEDEDWEDEDEDEDEDEEDVA